MPGLRHAAVAAALFTLSGYPVAAQPWVQSRSSDEITLRWYTDTTDQAQGLGLAGAYCAQIGRSAGLHEIERDGSAVIARYRCF